MRTPLVGDTRRVTRRLLATLLFALALTAPGVALAADPGPYVALGDSYTAAPLVPNQIGQPTGCARSDHDYPSLVAQALGVASFTDVSCSAATTDDMTAPQSVALGMNAPQFGALAAGTRLVTVGIGGNDVGLVEAAVKCASLGLSAPTGSACRTNYARSGRDEMVTRIERAAPKIAATLQGIQQRSPRARIVLVGYPDVLPRTGSGCWPVVPLSPDDVRYFDGLLVQTNQMLATQAAENGVEFADTYADSAGHDVCTLPGRKWFEGLVPTAPAFPLHPNALGMQSMARSVARVLRAPAIVPRTGKLARTKHAVGRKARSAVKWRRVRARR
jgi:lysophospholipase L1-like esterase